MTEEELFHAALAQPPAERAAFLDRACSGNNQLRAAVEALLAAHQNPGSFLNSPPPAAKRLEDLAATQDSGVAAEGEIAAMGEHISGSAGIKNVRSPQTATADFRADPVPGVVIGRYTLQEKIGEGGMGEVWVARQTEPVKRKVALKLIKTGMDSRAVLQRFEQERQALALMDHPNIARVLDGGMTSTGQPFFVMELVNGLSLTKFCDELRLPLKERLELFVPICQAVQHAHQKGIAHRDLKPANILVTMIDGKPVPKVIDFGVAKATSGKLTEETMSTGFGAVVGTLEYMSPEQAGFTGEDVDTRADIYSLGVILYELLTGLRPIDSKRLKKAALNEMIRIIQEEEPSKPSTRLSTEESLPSLAAVRQIEPRKLTALLRGELDWVVMKCLEKQRERRYETANGLARDIQRYLADEAVEARPPSAGYRMQKFIHRNRVVAAAGGAVAVALLIGAVAFAWQAKVARHQRDIAVAAQRAEAEQRKVADAASAEARKQEAEARKQAEEAKKQTAIAEAVTNFQTDMLAAVDPDQLAKDPVTKEPLRDKLTVVQVLEAAVQKLDEGSLSDQPLVEAGVRATIGNTLHNLGRFAEAEQNLRKVVEIRRAALPAEQLEFATALNNLATVLFDQNKLSEAESLFRESLKIDREVRPSDDPDIARVLDNIGKLLHVQNKFAEAEPLLREALVLRRMAFPPWDAEIALGLHNLAVVLMAKGKIDEAEPLCRESLQILRAAYPAGHPEIASGLNGLGLVLQAQDKLSEAEPLHREALKICRAAYPAGHHDIAWCLNNLATLLITQKRPAEAEPLLQEALEISRATFPDGHPNIDTVTRNLALVLQNQNKLAEAESLCRELLEINRAALPKDSPQIAALLAPLGVILLEQKKWTEAELKFREGLAILEKTEPDAWTTFNTHSLLGGALLGQHNYADAEPLLLKGYEGIKTREKSIPPEGETHIPEALDRLIGLYTAWHAAEPDKGYDAKAAEWQKKLDEHKTAAKGTPSSTEEK